MKNLKIYFLGLTLISFGAFAKGDCGQDARNGIKRITKVFIKQCLVQLPKFQNKANINWALNMLKGYHDIRNDIKTSYSATKKCKEVGTFKLFDVYFDYINEMTASFAGNFTSYHYLAIEQKGVWPGNYCPKKEKKGKCLNITEIKDLQRKHPVVTSKAWRNLLSAVSLPAHQRRITKIMNGKLAKTDEGNWINGNTASSLLKAAGNLENRLKGAKYSAKNKALMNGLEALATNMKTLKFKSENRRRDEGHDPGLMARYQIIFCHYLYNFSKSF